MEHAECTEQKGIVTGKQENKVIVRIERKSSCASCHARGACTSLDKQDKEIEVICDNADQYDIGEEVTVSISTRLGLKAVVIAFVIPFVILFVTLLCCISLFGLKEEVGSLLALTAITVYYVILFKARRILNRQFVFSIRKNFA